MGSGVCATSTDELLCPENSCSDLGNSFVRVGRQTRTTHEKLGITRRPSRVMYQVQLTCPGFQSRQALKCAYARHQAMHMRRVVPAKHKRRLREGVFLMELLRLEAVGGRTSTTT